ncbi:MAG: hypothetical protein IJ024_05695 [Lachnospiraceae bacterium]|nr:hypothetical protein [Lachnospiraceae bacterium]
MMATLLEVRQIIKRFYAKYDVYVKPVLKFILALVSFLMLNTKIGFMQQLRSPLVAVGLALVCAFLPLNVMVVLGGVLMIAHAYALSLEACAVTAGLIVVMYLLYFRISSRMGILLIITPLCFMEGIPYVVPLLGGLLFGPAAAVPAGCGAVIYYLINYMSLNSTSLGTGDVDGGATKVASLVDSLLTNKEMFLCVAAIMLTVLIVYFIRRLSVDHSWELAIGIGSVVNIVIHLAGALLPGVSVKIVPLLIGSVVSAAITFFVKFFVFSVDYTRTERVQFEDDEYYYYVKAVPKNVIAAPKKTVKKIVSQKKQTKTIKKIES